MLSKQAPRRHVFSEFGRLATMVFPVVACIDNHGYAFGYWDQGPRGGRGVSISDGGLGLGRLAAFKTPIGSEGGAKIKIATAWLRLILRLSLLESWCSC